MRISGGETLGEDAAAVVRQAVSLARRRGHAQVTPLHMANAMLSASPASVLRAACARSQSHPLQHNALNRCLDHALGHLAVFGSHRGGDRLEPAPSNAFAAALKRAQAHGRRGAVGGDEVELEQLVISILDDPSVDRVMRAAGFSTSQVRACVQNAVVPLDQSGKTGFHLRTRTGGQLSLETIPELQPPVVADVPGGSEFQASIAKFGARRPAFGGTEVVPTTASLPPWLRRYKDTTCMRSTYCGISLQADVACRRPKFTELTAQNLKIMCDALELRVPRHGNIVPGISVTVLGCRSGVMRRWAGGDKPSSSSSSTATWLLFRGRDRGGKMVVARELARLVFGSYADITTLTLQGNPDIPACTGELALKRQRSPENDGDGNGRDVGARLFDAIAENPHHVIFIDGVDRLGRDSEMRIRNAIAGGTMVGRCNGDAVGLEDAIVVLSSDVVVPASSPRVKRRCSGQNREEGGAAEMEVIPSRCLSWDLNICAVDGEEEEDGLSDDEGILNVVDGVFLFS